MSIYLNKLNGQFPIAGDDCTATLHTATTSSYATISVYVFVSNFGIILTYFEGKYYALCEREGIGTLNIENSVFE